jgi:hypothetical protein
MVEAATNMPSSKLDRRTFMLENAFTARRWGFAAYGQREYRRARSRGFECDSRPPQQQEVSRRLCSRGRSRQFSLNHQGGAESGRRSIICQTGS